MVLMTQRLIHSPSPDPFSLFYSINEINAADLPSEVKVSLKQLAHSVAGSIVCDLGEVSTIKYFD